MGTTDTFMVSYDYNPEKDNAVLVIARQTSKKAIKIINAFQGDEATELYNKLVTVKKKED